MLYQLNVSNGFCQFAGPAKFLKIVSAASPLKIEVIANGPRSGRVLLSSKNVRAPMGFELPADAGVVNFYGDDQSLEIWSADAPLEYMQLTAVGGSAIKASEAFLRGGTEKLTGANTRSKIKIKPEADINIGGLGVGTNGYPVLAGQEVELETVGEVYAYTMPPAVRPSNSGVVAFGVSTNSPENNTGMLAGDGGYYFKNNTTIYHWDGTTQTNVGSVSSQAGLINWKGKNLVVSKGLSSDKIIISQIVNKSLLPMFEFSGNAPAQGACNLSTAGDLLLVDSGPLEIINLANGTLVNSLLKAPNGFGGEKLQILESGEIFGAPVSGACKVWALTGQGTAQVVNTLTDTTKINSAYGSDGKVIYGIFQSGSKAAISTDFGRTFSAVGVSAQTYTACKMFGQLAIYVNGRVVYGVAPGGAEVVEVVTLSSVQHPASIISESAIAIVNSDLFVVEQTDRIATKITLNLDGNAAGIKVSLLEFLI